MMEKTETNIWDSTESIKINTIGLYITIEAQNYIKVLNHLSKFTLTNNIIHTSPSIVMSNSEEPSFWRYYLVGHYNIDDNENFKNFTLTKIQITDFFIELIFEMKIKNNVQDCLNEILNKKYLEERSSIQLLTKTVETTKQPYHVFQEAVESFFIEVKNKLIDCLGKNVINYNCFSKDNPFTIFYLFFRKNFSIKKTIPEYQSWNVFGDLDGSPSEYTDDKKIYFFDQVSTMRKINKYHLFLCNEEELTVGSGQFDKSSVFDFDIRNIFFSEIILIKLEFLLNKLKNKVINMKTPKTMKNIDKLSKQILLINSFVCGITIVENSHLQTKHMKIELGEEHFYLHDQLITLIKRHIQFLQSSSDTQEKKIENAKTFRMLIANRNYFIITCFLSLFCIIISLLFSDCVMIFKLLNFFNKLLYKFDI